MIEYNLGPHQYTIRYSELRDKYIEFVYLEDEDFLKRLPEALHLACVISWFKERGQWSVADTGVVHEIAHWMHLGDGDYEGRTLAKLREVFRTELELAP